MADKQIVDILNPGNQVNKTFVDAGGGSLMEKIAAHIDGSLYQNLSSADQHSAAATLITAPAAGKFVVLDALVISVAGANTVTLTEHTGTVTIFKHTFPAAGVYPIQLGRRGLHLTQAACAVDLETSATGQVDALAVYHLQSN